MAKKEKTLAKELDAKWLRLGNFLLGREKNSTGNFLVCKSLAQNWSVRWREDTLMYGTLISLMQNEAHDYLHSLITVMFVCSTYPHDMLALINTQKMPFMEGIAKLVKEQNEYEASLAKKPTEEEEKEALETEGRLQEMGEKLQEELDKEE